MSTLIIVISIAVLIFGSVVDLKKKLATQQSEGNVEEENCEECMNSEENESEEMSEDYYYSMNMDEPVMPEQPKKSKTVQPTPMATTVAHIEEDEPVFNFDLRQAVINQAILQNDYVDNLK